MQNGFVYLTAFLRHARYEIRYATDENFTGSPVDGYRRPAAVASEALARALSAAEASLRPKGLALVVYDAYRPLRAVEAFLDWTKRGAEGRKDAYYPDIDKAELFDNGFLAYRSAHTRGAAVDVSLVRISDGCPLDMGGAFDVFGPRSHTACRGLTLAQRRNRLLLRHVMADAGFVPYDKEWWHFRLRREPFPDTYFDFPVE